MFFSKEKNKVADAELRRLEALMNQAKLELSYTKIYTDLKLRILCQAVIW